MKEIFGDQKWSRYLAFFCLVYVVAVTIVGPIWLLSLPGRWGGKGGLEWDADIRARMIFIVASWFASLTVLLVMAAVQALFKKRWKATMWIICAGGLGLLFSIAIIAPLFAHSK